MTGAMITLCECGTVKSYYAKQCQSCSRLPLPTPVTKVCARCGETRSTEDWPLDRRARDGLWSYCRPCQRDVSRESVKLWKQRHPERAKRIHRNSALKAKYGISIDDFEQMVEDQGGVCLSCGEVPEPRKGILESGFHVDHDHATDEVRGLLCHLCNVIAGMANDDVDRLRAVIRYLERGE